MASYKQYLDGAEESLDMDHVSRPGNDTIKFLSGSEYICPRGCMIVKVKATGNTVIGTDTDIGLWSIGADTSAAADIVAALTVEDADEISGPFSKVSSSLKALIWVRTGA